MIKKETIRDCFNLLESDYGKQTNQKRELWGKMFKEYTDKQLVEAVGEFLRIGKYFPRVSDIIILIEGNYGDESELAWIYLLEKVDRDGYYNSVSFPKYPAIAGVVEALGGWMEFTESLTEEQKKWVKKEFIKLYPIIKKRGEYPEKLLGFYEIENNKKYTEEFMLERYGKKLDGEKVEREKIEGSENKLLEKGGGIIE